MFEEDIHQAVCHVSRCLGLERSRDNELAEEILMRIFELKYGKFIFMTVMRPNYMYDWNKD